MNSFLLRQFETAKDNQFYNSIYLTSSEIEEVLNYHKEKYRKEKKRVIVKAYNLNLNKWVNIDPVTGVTDEGSGAGSGNHEDLTNILGGATNDHYHFTGSQHSKLLTGNYIGDWDASINSPVIPSASSSNKDQFYRVVVPGNSLINGFSEWEIGDLIYSIGSQWIRIVSNAEAKPAKYTTIIEINGTILAGTTISLLASGLNYTKTGDNPSLGSTISVFNDREAIQIYRNGLYQRKGNSVNYVSSSSISFPVDLKQGETLVILS